MIENYNDYRSYLKSILIERSKSNPNYSLRAFSRDIGISAALLSQIFTGARSISNRIAYTISNKLNHSESEQEFFCTLVSLEKETNPELREIFLRKLKTLRPKTTIHDSSIDSFQLMAEWYHSAILELTNISEFSLAPVAIAQKLDISPLEATEALERLERLMLLEKNTHGQYQKTKRHIQFKSEHANDALRKYHKQMLEKAIVSLTEQSPSEKNVGSETFAISKDQLKEARELTENYFNQMIRLSQKGKKPKTDVYHLGVQFFNLTTQKRKPS